MKIVSWNINGIRSLKSKLNQIVEDLDADILCLQETKISRNLVEETTAFIDGYNSYFSFPRHLSGYSGVATYCKDSCKPVDANESLIDMFKENDTKQNIFANTFQPSEFLSLDSEGRVLITKHSVRCCDNSETLVVINVYCPCADPEKPERKDFKLRFYQLLQHKTETFLQEGCHVLIVGDLNTTHRIIDHCDPGKEEEFRQEPARQWIDSFLYQQDKTGKGTNGQMVDTFRYFHPEAKEAYTCWNSKTRARLTNYGTRIDYILADKNFIPHLKDSFILSDVQGSDHCPVAAIFECFPQPSKSYPHLCTRNWPEFVGKQQKLIEFFKNNSSTNCESERNCKRKEEAVKLQIVKKRKNAYIKQNSIVQFLSTKNGILYNNKTVKHGNDSKLVDNSFNEETVLSYHKNKGEISDSFKHCTSVKTEQQIECNKTISNNNNKQKELWKTILSGPPTAPLCKGHQEPCEQKTVRKGTNIGKQFFTCARPNGHPSNPEASCNHFQWINF